VGKKSYETSLQLHRQDFFAFIHPSRFSPPTKPQFVIQQVRTITLCSIIFPGSFFNPCNPIIQYSLPLPEKVVRVFASQRREPASRVLAVFKDKHRQQKHQRSGFSSEPVVQETQHRRPASTIVPFDIFPIPCYIQRAFH